MITLFGIKNCDTVKKARRWLDNHSIEYQFHDFRVDGITANQVNNWLDTAGIESLINKRSTTWKSLSETQKQMLSPENAVALILEQPTLIKRPVLITNNGIHIGFKESSYQSIFK
jgi:arsenate reductase